MAAPKLSELDKSTNQKLFELALGVSDKALERARAAGTFIQGAAAALGTLYTGILTFVFVAKDNPLPARGLIPTLFFALAVALAAFYAAFISQRGGLEQPATDEVTGDDPLSDEVRMYMRVAWYVTWTDGMTRARQSFLRAAVVSLAVGVFLMPVPFFGVGSTRDTGTDDKTANASPTPWPTPAFTGPPELAAVLYDHQLDEFRAGADKGESEKTQADPTTDQVTIGLGLVGLALVAVTLLWPKVPRRIRRPYEKWLEPLE